MYFPTKVGRKRRNKISAERRRILNLISISNGQWAFNGLEYWNTGRLE
jgi:hypothetical protein